MKISQSDTYLPRLTALPSVFCVNNPLKSKISSPFTHTVKSNALSNIKEELT